MCGGVYFTTVIIFCDNCFNDFDHSLPIIFNLGACTTFYNVSYKTSYVRNMYASLLVLIGSTKIVFVSYVYNINMCFISLLLVIGKPPVKYVCIYPVSVFASTIAADTLLFFPSLFGK